MTAVTEARLRAEHGRLARRPGAEDEPIVFDQDRVVLAKLGGHLGILLLLLGQILLPEPGQQRPRQGLAFDPDVLEKDAELAVFQGEAESDFAVEEPAFELERAEVIERPTDPALEGVAVNPVRRS